MAVRSKYSDLPGIDKEPDVFETPDVVEKGEKNGDSPVQNGDENVHLLKIDTNAAFTKFSGKYLHSSDVDFSGKSGPRKVKGYVTKTEYEMLEEGTVKETPQHKFNRLQHEIRELAEELEQIKGTVESENEEKKLSAVSLVQEVQTLQKQLEDLHLVNVLGKEALTLASTPESGLSERLQTQLEAFKTSDATSTKQEKGDNSCVKYELFYKPEHAKFNQLSKVQNAINGKVYQPFGILHHLSTLTDKKEGVENAAKLDKVTELYDFLNKWDSFVDVVPDLISRLQSLKSLHEQASHFGQSLLQLDSSQSTLNSQIQGQAKLLNELEASFAANVSAVEANCERVESRVNVLLEKFETKGR
ncbi:PREDICTED: dynactin subunit 2-like [Acropora digitifera]|uniref:dynactin subunit 2-like n=1 Tax=Acropora digitifera TaxID=70779 RepID=UPI00077A423C|nr:PREDICTED: dynactin subunit 2-like [Acropora digitifera]